MEQRTSEDGTAAGPTASARQIDRARLLDRLDGVTGRPLTVITGPLGSGKTNLVAQWCAERCPLPVTWLVASEVDDLETAIGRAVGEGPRVVVVDDVRAEADAEKTAGVARALRSGGSLHLLLISRRPLTSALGAWRLDPSFDQLRESDLRLTPTELASLVQAHRGQRPDPSVSAALCDAVDGWFAAGVLLAASWEDRVNLSNFRSLLVDGFEAATALAVTATLTDSDPQAGELLRTTAELPELAGPLCDEITGREDGHIALRSLRDAGALLATRRNDPSFVRLHPLARAGLSQQAARTAAQRREIVQAGARWYAGHQRAILAAACYSELGDWDTAGQLVLDHLHDIERYGWVDELAETIATFPMTWMRQHFRWVFLSAWMLFNNGDWGGGLALLAAVEPDLRKDQLIAAEFIRASRAAYATDPLPCLEAAERSVALCDEVGEDCTFDDLIGTSRTEHWRVLSRGIGLLAGAYLGAWERIAPLDVPIPPNVAVELRPGAMAAARGRRSAHATFAGALATAEHEIATLAATIPAGDLHAIRQGLQAMWADAEVHRGRAMFDAVPELLDAAVHQESASVSRNLGILTSVATTRALLQLDLQQPAAALQVLADHRAATDHQPPPILVGLLAAAEGQAHAALGDWERARHVLTRAPRTAAVATVLVLTSLDRGDLTTANAVVAAWPDDPSIRSRLGQELSLAAIAERRGARQDALRHLTAALAIAAPEGLVQPVLQMGVHLLGPLWYLAQNSVEPGVAKLAEQTATMLRSTGRASPRLTARERLVLHQLATGATLPAIADQLMVSVNTVKSQVKSIYRKLAASNRDEALATWRLLQADQASQATR